MQKGKKEKEGRKGMEKRGRGKKGNEEGKGKWKKRMGRWKEESLRKVERTHGRTDTQVILYFVKCFALHCTDKNYFTDLVA